MEFGSRVYSLFRGSFQNRLMPLIDLFLGHYPIYPRENEKPGPIETGPGLSGG